MRRNIVCASCGKRFEAAADHLQHVTAKRHDTAPAQPGVEGPLDWDEFARENGYRDFEEMVAP